MAGCWILLLSIGRVNIFVSCFKALSTNSWVLERHREGAGEGEWRGGGKEVKEEREKRGLVWGRGRGMGDVNKGRGR